MKASFEEKFDLVRQGVISALKQELGEDGLKAITEDVVKNITEGYMLAVQCQWYRLDDTKKVDTLISKYQEATQIAMELLKTYGFDDLVYTYRANKTNLYEVRGVGRKYHLGYKDYLGFLESVKNQKIKVLTKQVSVKKAPKETQSVSFIVDLVSVAKGNTPTAKPSTKSGKAKPKKDDVLVKDIKDFEVTNPNQNKIKFISNLNARAAKTAKSTTKSGWVEHDMAGFLEEKTFIKIKLQDNTNVFARFLGITKKDNVTMVNVNDHGVERDINVNDIAKVFTYQK